MKERTHIVKLTKKTRKDTLFRFLSLKELINNGEIKNKFQTKVPKFAITLGISNILESKKIFVLGLI
jgi:6-phosphogluconolactonase/glucosamine-6-phosphate isomerase/deaminase